MRTSVLRTSLEPTRMYSPVSSTRNKRALRGQGQLSHLIEKQRTSVGRPEIAFALSYRPGKSSFLMTEQFGIYRSLRNGTAIHGKVFLRLSQAVVVDNTGNDFLSHTALSGDQYG